MNSSQNLEDDFAGLYKNTPEKIVSVTLSLLFALVGIPIGLSVMWYERFGSDIKRTILNKLVYWNNSDLNLLIKTLKMNSSEDHFAGLYKNSPEKIATVILSSLIVLISIPINLSVMWYEKFGSDIMRTILNKLVTSISFVAIEYYLFVWSFDIMRIFVGPLPEPICSFALIMQASIGIQFFLYIDTITLVRYIFIFHLKNPGKFNNDFWTRFANLWIFGFTFLSQSSHFVVPDVRYVHFYCCTGYLPQNENTQNHRGNIVFYGVPILSLFIHIFVNIKIYLYKKNHNKSVQTSIIDCMPNNNFFTYMSNQTLADFTTNIITIAVSTTGLIIIYQINTIPPIQINNFPYNIYFFIIHFFYPLSFTCFMPVVFYFRHKYLRNTVLNEIKKYLGLDYFQINN